MSEREKCLEGCKARQLIEPDAHAPSCPNAQPATTPPDDTARLDWLEKHGQRLRRSRMGKPWRAIALANALQDDGPASRPCETAREAIDWMRRDGDHCADCDSTHSHDPWCSHNLKALPPPPEQDGGPAKWTKNPRYEPKTHEQKLAYLVEELGEVLAAAGKTLRWGPDSTNPELPEDEQETNAEWLFRELRDLDQAVAMVRTLLLEKIWNER